MTTQTTKTTTIRQGKSSRGRCDNGAPNPIDTHVGARMRLRRTLLGMSQEKLAEALGLTFQQVQKYERGTNRIGASRLFDLAGALDVPVSYFFDDISAETRAHSPVCIIKGMVSTADTAPSWQADPLHRREILELVRDFDALPSDDARASIRRTIKAVLNAFGIDRHDANPVRPLAAE